MDKKRRDGKRKKLLLSQTLVQSLTEKRPDRNAGPEEKKKRGRLKKNQKRSWALQGDQSIPEWRKRMVRGKRK